MSAKTQKAVPAEVKPEITSEAGETSLDEQASMTLGDVERSAKEMAPEPKTLEELRESEKDKAAPLPLLDEKGPTESELKAIEKEQETEIKIPETFPPMVSEPCPIDEKDFVPLEVKVQPGYFLQDGSGPFADIQLAMDALGMPALSRPKHKRYSRLSSDLKAKIIDRTG